MCDRLISNIAQDVGTGQTSINVMRWQFCHILKDLEKQANEVNGLEIRVSYSDKLRKELTDGRDHAESTTD